MKKQQTKQTEPRKRQTREVIHKFMENFHKHFNDEGLSICEIAELYDINMSTAYRRLEDIAKLNGVSVDAYKTEKRKSGNSRVEKREDNRTKTEEEKIQEIEYNFSKVLTEIRDIIQKVNNCLKDNYIDN